MILSFIKRRRIEALAQALGVAQSRHDEARARRDTRAMSVTLKALQDARHALMRAENAYGGKRTEGAA